MKERRENEHRQDYTTLHYTTIHNTTLHYTLPYHCTTTRQWHSPRVKRGKGRVIIIIITSLFLIILNWGSFVRESLMGNGGETALYSRAQILNEIILSLSSSPVTLADTTRTQVDTHILHEYTCWLTHMHTHIWTDTYSTCTQNCVHEHAHTRVYVCSHLVCLCVCVCFIRRPTHIHI